MVASAFLFPVIFEKSCTIRYSKGNALLAAGGLGDAEAPTRTIGPSEGTARDGAIVESTPGVRQESEITRELGRGPPRCDARFRCILIPAIVLTIGISRASAAKPSLSLDANACSDGQNTLTADTAPSYPNDLRLTLYWENESSPTKPWDPHDRHYTAGVGMSLAWRAPWVDNLLRNVPSIGDEFSGNTDYAMGLVGALTIFTPADITASGPISTDRPFAGYTYAGLFFQRAHRIAFQDFPLPLASSILDLKSYSSFESLELDIGILGPSSLAENAQEMIHHQFDDPSPNGWGNQIHDEPEFSLKYNRRWRSQAVQPIATIPISFQAIPEAGAIAGSLQDEVHAGATFRIGYNLPDDFGPG